MTKDLQQQRIFFCINPRAGGGKAMAWWQENLPYFESRNLGFFWQFSGGGVKTSQQVRRAVLHSGANLVIAIGGDGHMHDVLNGIVDNDTLISPDLVLGLFPAGSGCDFARMVYPCKGDNTKNTLLDLLSNGVIRHIDVGRADFLDNAGQRASAYFLNACDIGLGAQTCLRVNAYGGLLKSVVRNGRRAFLLAALQSLLWYTPPYLYVEADGETLDGQYLIAALGNGRYMGGNMCLFPKASLDDAQLDLLLVPAFPRANALMQLPKVYSGAIHRVPGAVFRHAKDVCIGLEPPQALEMDGETLGLAPFSAKVLPGLLPLLCFNLHNS